LRYGAYRVRFGKCALPLTNLRPEYSRTRAENVGRPGGFVFVATRGSPGHLSRHFTRGPQRAIMRPIFAQLC
jgi:hypothetical protein